MADTIPALLPLSVLEAVQNIDTPADDGLGALADELASKRLGMSATVAAQASRYRELVDSGTGVDREEALAVFRLVGRRADAALVFDDAGRRAARHAAHQRGGLNRATGAILPGRAGQRSRLQAVQRLSRRWLLLPTEPAGELVRAVAQDTLPLAARPDGVGCRFYTAALGELLRQVAGIEGAIVHEACRGKGDSRCIWRAERAEGYE